jgi:hypothetical protein
VKAGSVTVAALETIIEIITDAITEVNTNNISAMRTPVNQLE